ncbi:MAG: hypothetical protein ACLUOI_17375 [Eisenbergiella sp.]
MFETLKITGFTVWKTAGTPTERQWATSLTRHNGRFYACFVSHDCGKTYIFLRMIEKSGWDRRKSRCDMSFLFWEGLYWCMERKNLHRELEPDLSGVRKRNAQGAY